MVVRVQTDLFDAGAELNSYAQTRANVGAVVSFIGDVRDPKGDLSEMQIEHYPGMTERAIGKIVEEAVTRWGLVDAMVIHRHGNLKPGAPIMMVATAAAHRAAAFEAADFLMDYLKSRAPFWKKEITSSGADWGAAKDEDEIALNRW